MLLTIFYPRLCFHLACSKLDILNHCIDTHTHKLVLYSSLSCIPNCSFSGSEPPTSNTIKCHICRSKQESNNILFIFICSYRKSRIKIRCIISDNNIKISQSDVYDVFISFQCNSSEKRFPSFPANSLP